jgi:hypothetical protein
LDQFITSFHQDTSFAWAGLGGKYNFNEFEDSSGSVDIDPNTPAKDALSEVAKEEAEWKLRKVGMRLQRQPV